MSTATVSVLASGFVAVAVPIAVPLVTEALSLRRRVREVRDARLDEVRTVVDSAAVALMDLYDSVPQADDPNVGPEAVQQVLMSLPPALNVARREEARLAARLGTLSEVVAAHRRALARWSTLVRYWRDIFDGSTPVASWEDTNAAWSTAVDEFFDAAAGLVGVDRS